MRHSKVFVFFLYGLYLNTHDEQCPMNGSELNDTDRFNFQQAWESISPSNNYKFPQNMEMNKWMNKERNMQTCLKQNKEDKHHMRQKNELKLDW